MDPLYELLASEFERPDSSSANLPRPSSSTQATSYLNRLSTLSLSELTSTEPAALLQSAQSHLRNLQALSKRSHKTVISSSTHLSSLTSLLPSLGTQAKTLHHDLPNLESSATEFASKYDRSRENTVLDRRKRATLLTQNVERVSDVLDLPSLLSSTIPAAQSSTVSSSSSTTASYATALDLHAHIKRLHDLYPQSELVASIFKQAESEMQNLTTILITSLQSQSLKLASAMRTIGWLRRVAPDLADDDHGSMKHYATSMRSFKSSAHAPGGDGALGSLFLLCRLQTLHGTLEALEPLRELADTETKRRKQGVNSKLLQQKVTASALGSQSERYLKRYVEIFREQSFSIVSMYKSIFPNGLPTPDGMAAGPSTKGNSNDITLPLPSPLSSFAMHLVDMLMETLREYMPNITDKSARESLLTQVLYCAGSLGRLGADFGMMIALLEDDMRAETGLETQTGTEEDREWVEVMKKHRVQASRLEVLARGVGSGRKTSLDVQSPTVLSPG